MEHTVIVPPGAQPAPMGAFALPPDMLDTLALHGLRELTFAPIPVLARALSGFDRHQLGTAIEVMIAMLDAADGDVDDEAEDSAGETVAIVADPDLPEEEGEDDDEDCCSAHEDDASAFGGPLMGFGSDHDHYDPDRETTYPEWHTLPWSHQRSGRFEGRALDSDPGGFGRNDDSEDEGDRQDAAWCEPHSWDYHQRATMEVGSRNEDDEEDDDSGCPLDRGEKTTIESFGQGCGSAPHEDDDDEPRYVPAAMRSMEPAGEYLNPYASGWTANDAA